MNPEIICLTNGMFQQNCYIVADTESKEAVIVDPGEEADLFLRRIEYERLTLREIWLTHAHLDHVMGVGEIARQTGADIRLHPGDRPLYDNFEAQGAKYGIPVEALPEPDHEMTEGESLAVGQFEFVVRHVPGHSPGGVALVGCGCVFSGDALFAGSIGRTDLPGGDMGTLMSSIERQLLTLPDETIVYSGHGPATTIGAERRSNPFIAGAIRSRM